MLGSSKEGSFFISQKNNPKEFEITKPTKNKQKLNKQNNTRIIIS